MILGLTLTLVCGMSDVTVLGMGRALASALVETGRSVTVWNRTPGREPDQRHLGTDPGAAALYDLAGVRTDMVTAMGELLHRGVAAGPGVSLVDLLLESAGR